MRILYVAGIVSIFILFAAILSVMTRILRSPQLDSGAEWLPSREDEIEDDRVSEADEAEMFPTLVAEYEPYPDAYPEPVAPVPMPSPALPRKTQKSGRKPRTRRIAAATRGFRSEYAFMLEGFVVGVTLVVLAQTQRRVFQRG